MAMRAPILIIASSADRIRLPRWRLAVRQANPKTLEEPMKHKIFSLKGWLMIAATLGLTALSFARPAFAQQPTGSIEGTVTDPSGAVINGATITARDVTTNQSRSTTTR